MKKKFPEEVGFGSMVEIDDEWYTVIEVNQSRDFIRIKEEEYIYAFHEVSSFKNHRKKIKYLRKPDHLCQEINFDGDSLVLSVKVNKKDITLPNKLDRRVRWVIETMISDGSLFYGEESDIVSNLKHSMLVLENGEHLYEGEIYSIDESFFEQARLIIAECVKNKPVLFNRSLKDSEGE